MKHIKEVVIQWREELFVEGKRKLPDSQTLYSYIRVNENTWSVVFSFDTTPREQGYETMGSVKFLVESAPHHILKTGLTFPLYDGANVLAACTIL